jgi:hypothetical protein
MDSSDGVCRISASGEIRKNTSVSSEFISALSFLASNYSASI